MKKICNRFFAPGVNSITANLGLLVLRVWLGATMFCLHGLDKFQHFSAYSEKFPDLLHIGSKGTLSVVIFAEFFCAALLVLGFLSRFAAIVLAINMSVALTMAHHFVLKGEHSGELAFIYFAAFVTLLIAGPGRFSIDSALFSKPSKV